MGLETKENEHKIGEVRLREFIVTWDYDNDGRILITLSDENEKFIQSLEHVKSKF